MKPAYEPIILARKPGPMRELGIDSCRIGTDDVLTGSGSPPLKYGGTNHRPFHDHAEPLGCNQHPAGRWPANLILECTCDETREGTAHSSAGAVKRKPGHDGAAYGSDQRPEGTKMVGYGKEPVRIHTDPNCPCAMLDGQTGTLTSGVINPRTVTKPTHDGTSFPSGARSTDRAFGGDSGGASRFFYNSKSSTRERNEGVSGLFVTLELEVCPCGESTEQVTSLVRAISEWETGQDGQGCSTSSSGRPSSGQFLTVTVSTTSTETSKTAVLKTSSVWTSQPISESIAAVLGTLPDCGISLAASAESLSQSLTTTNEQAESVRGAKTVVSETPLRVSASVRLQGNLHPTCKPVQLMRWLVRLVARPGDVVLDPFMGSGTTGVACAMEGREFIGIEREGEYIEIARRRIDHASAQGRLPLDESPPLPPVAGRPT